MLSNLMRTTLALIAHDQRKKEMVSFCLKHLKQLARLSLIATGRPAAGSPKRPACRWNVSYRAPPAEISRSPPASQPARCRA